uniref:DNA alkylation repair enzyme n=1 Tax=Strongyloides venezuelensis TaxID=75913 RepID=A0A0K0FM24_STRVS
MNFKSLYKNYIISGSENIDITNLIEKCNDEKFIKNGELEKLFEIVLLSKNYSYFVDIFKNIKNRLGIVPNVMKFFVTEPFGGEKEIILKNNCKIFDSYISEFISSESWELRDSAIILAMVLDKFIRKIPYDTIVNIIKCDRSEYVRSCAVDYAKENYFTLLMEDIWVVIAKEWNSIVRRSLLKVIFELPNQKLKENEKEKYITSIKNNVRLLEVYCDDDDWWIIENLKKLDVLYKEEVKINNSHSTLNKKESINKNSLLEAILFECQNKEELQNKECYGD